MHQITQRPLTKREQKAMVEIKNFHSEVGRVPLQTGLASLLSISKSNAKNLLIKLEDKGELVRNDKDELCIVV